MPIDVDELDDDNGVAHAAPTPITKSEPLGDEEAHDEAAVIVTAAAARSQPSSSSAPAVRRTRGPGKRHPENDASTANSHLKLMLDDGFVPQECRGHDTRRMAPPWGHEPEPKEAIDNYLI
jgi:hypothetical protein